MSIVFNLGALIITGIKTGKAWDHASTKLRACGMFTGVIEFICLSCHLYGPITKDTPLENWYNERFHSALHVLAFALQALVVGALSWIKIKHHSSIKPVEDMGWSVFVLGVANLLVGPAANGVEWYKWINGLIGKLIRIYDEWISQRRTVEAQGDEEHEIGVSQLPAPATPRQSSIFLVGNNRTDQHK